MKILLSVLLIIFFASCTKEHIVFKKVDVQQSGELVRVSGYIPGPLTYEFAYSVKVKFCDKWVDLLVTILPGQVNGYRDYVTDESVACRFSEYHIQWQTHLVQ